MFGERFLPNQEEKIVSNDAPLTSLSRRQLLGGAAALAGAAALPRGVGRALAQATPVSGGSFRVTLGAEPDTLDPHKGDTLFDLDVFSALYDALISDDLSNGVQGNLAESWDSPDGITWTFKLKSATFHDGSAVDSAAVKATIDRTKDAAIGAVGSVTVVTNQITSVDTPDP